MYLVIHEEQSQKHHVHCIATPSWLPYSTYLYLDFHLLFHDKAKRTQQGDLLSNSIKTPNSPTHELDQEEKLYSRHATHSIAFKGTATAAWFLLATFRSPACVHFSCKESQDNISVRQSLPSKPPVTYNTFSTTAALRSALAEGSSPVSTILQERALLLV